MQQKIHLSKIVIFLISLVIILIVLAPAKVEGSGGSAPYGASLLITATQDSSNFLEDFAFLPGSALVIEDHYVLALYENAEKKLYALAVFTANCDGERCAIQELIAYSIFDAEGQDLQLASQPRAKERPASATRRL